MEQNRRGVPLPAGREMEGGDGAGGSVRRARERMAAELPSQRPVPNGQSWDPFMGARLVKQPPSGARNPAQTRKPGPMPSALTAQRGHAGNIGAAISKPAPMPAQWPLREDSSTTQGLSTNPPDQRSPPRGPPPQRPPRPTHVASLLDSSKIQEYTPSYPYRQAQQQQTLQTQPLSRPQPQRSVQYYEDTNQRSPHSASTPQSGSSSDRPSNGSSIGPIPDFPVPAVPASIAIPPRRNQSLGLPPLSRRGGSSYYSRSSYVTPIPEEFSSPTAKARAGGSYASSRVMPSSWGSQPDDFDIDHYRETIDEDDEEGRRSSGSKHEHDESARLVRQASLGKMAKPALTTIKGSEDPNRSAGQQPKQIDVSKGGVVGRGAVAAGAAAGVVAGGMGNKSEKADLKPAAEGRTLTFNESNPKSSDADPEEVALGRAQSPRQPSPLASPIERTRSPNLSPADAQAQILGGLEKGGIHTPTPAMSDRISDTRRPPRLDMDAVKEAQARGSMTSLSDLIKRATRLASNLDRGRTASRLGMADFLNFQNVGKDAEKLSPADGRRRSGSISDILASFPPPGLATPTGERPTSRWPSPFQSNLGTQLVHSDNKSQDSTGKQLKDKGRRSICGMPLWAFILLAIVLFLLVAAAVVVPVMLIVVLPRQHSHSHNTSDLTFCSTSAPCKNGGLSVVNNNACQCICTDGFTGDRCTVASDAACTTSDVTGGTSALNNVTLGDTIPRLLEDSQANFSIPLNTSQLLSLFSANNLSCTSENALVTFTGQGQKLRRFYPYHETEANFVDDTNAPVPTGKVDLDRMLQPRQGVATTNGIVYAISTSSASGSSPTSTSRSPSSTSGNATGSDVDQTVLDFAKIAILFVLQKTCQLTSAMAVQDKIQAFFTGTTAQNSSMTMAGTGSMQNFTINFQNFSIVLNDGTVVGGKSNASQVSG